VNLFKIKKIFPRSRNRTFISHLHLSHSPQKRKSWDDYSSRQALSSTDSTDDEEQDELEEDEPLPYTPSASSPKQQLPPGQASTHDDHSSLRKPVNEYEAGRVICELCGVGVSIRDERTGVFSVAKWNEHRSSWSVAFFCSCFPQVPIVAFFFRYI
jgi:hypothetical protein